MSHYGNFLFSVFIYLISNNKCIVVESSGSSTSKTGVDLDITSESSTNEFEYKKDGQYVTYTAEDTKAFQLVKDGTTEVWKTTESTNYSTKVEVDNIFADSKAVTICLDGGQTKIFKKDYQNTKWEEIDLTIVNFKPININYESESYFYTNELKGKIRTFSAKTGFSFKGANEYINDKKVEIWKTNKDSEYSNKIEVEGNNKVTIHIADGTTASTKVFKKGTYGKWAEDNSEPESSSSETDTSTSQTGGSSGTGSSITGFFSRSTSSPSPESSAETPVGRGPDEGATEDAGSAEPTAGGGGEAKGITSGSSIAAASTTVQSAGSQQSSTGTSTSTVAAGQAGTKATVPSTTPTKTSFVQQPSSSATEKDSTSGGSSGTWDAIKGWLSCSSCGSSESSTETPEGNENEKTATVDIKKPLDQGYQSTNDNYILTYTPRGDYSFNAVKEDSKEIWKAEKKEDYSKKVMADFAKKVVTIYIGSDGGSTKVYKKGSDGTWKEDTDGSTVPTKTGSEPESSSSETEDKSTSCGWLSGIWSSVSGWFSSCGWRKSCESSESSETDTGTSGWSSSCTSSRTWDTIKGWLFCKCCKFGGSSAETSSDSSQTSIPKTGVDLNIKSDKKTTKKFEYEKAGQYVTYTAKDNYGFKLVKDHKTEIWKESKASNYSDRVEVQFLSTYAKAITVFLHYDQTRLFTRIDTDVPWNEIDTTILNLKYVNIDYPHESYFYKNLLQGETRTFTAKKGFAFKAAVEYIDDNIVTVWKATNLSEYANKIVNEGDNKVTLHLANGSTKVIEKGSDGQWPGATVVPIKSNMTASVPQPSSSVTEQASTSGGSSSNSKKGKSKEKSVPKSGPDDDSLNSHDAGGT